MEHETEESENPLVLQNHIMQHGKVISTSQKLNTDPSILPDDKKTRIHQLLSIGLTCTISRSRVTATATSMGHSDQHFVGHINDVSGRIRFQVGNETDTTVLLLERSIVKSLGTLLASTDLEGSFGRILKGAKK
jgi:hypothetical protein